MIRHQVLFKVRSSVSKEAISHAFDLLFELQNQLPGILKMAAGQCRFHEGKGEGFFTYGFSIDFENEAAYEAFLSDPMTHPAKGCIINMTVDGMDGIVGFDLSRSNYVYPNPAEKRRIPIPRLVLVPKGARGYL